MDSTCKMSLETTLLIVGHLLPHRAHPPSGAPEGPSRLHQEKSSRHPEPGGLHLDKWLLFSRFDVWIDI